MGSANCGRNLTERWGVTCDGLASHSGGVAILLAVSCYRNRSYVSVPISQLGLQSFIFDSIVMYEWQKYDQHQISPHNINRLIKRKHYDN